MIILLPSLAIALAAGCIWLSMRLVSRRAPRAKWPVAFAIGVLAVSACCLRYEIFASPSDLPAPGWREEFGLFADDAPLQNIPVVRSTIEHSEGWTVLVANEGSTTLMYSAEGSSVIQVFQEFEEMGHWAAANWDWCGTGKSVYEIAPGEQVEVAVAFWDVRRERMLGCFQEKGTNRCGIVVLATESAGVSLDRGMIFFILPAVITAGCVWLTVRIINRRERWAKWTAAAIILVPLIYFASCGPVLWLYMKTGSPQWMDPVMEYGYAPVRWAAESNDVLHNCHRDFIEWWMAQAFDRGG